MKEDKLPKEEHETIAEIEAEKIKQKLESLSSDHVLGVVTSHDPDFSGDAKLTTAQDLLASLEKWKTAGGGFFLPFTIVDESPASNFVEKFDLDRKKRKEEKYNSEFERNKRKERLLAAKEKNLKTLEAYPDDKELLINFELTPVSEPIRVTAGELRRLNELTDADHWLFPFGDNDERALWENPDEILIVSDNPAEHDKAINERLSEYKRDVLRSLRDHDPDDAVWYILFTDEFSHGNFNIQKTTVEELRRKIFGLTDQDWHHFNSLPHVIHVSSPDFSDEAYLQAQAQQILDKAGESSKKADEHWARKKLILESLDQQEEAGSVELFFPKTKERISVSLDEARQRVEDLNIEDVKEFGWPLVMFGKNKK